MTNRLVRDGRRVILFSLLAMTNRLVYDENKAIMFSLLLAQLTLRR